MHILWNFVYAIRLAHSAGAKRLSRECFQSRTAWCLIPSLISLLQIALQMKSLTVLLASAVLLTAVYSFQADSRVMVYPINTDPVSMINTDHDCSTSKINTEYDARGPQAQAAEGLSQEMIETILNTHNEYRKKHGAQNLVWNSTAAAYGKKWIERCKFKHSGGLVRCC